MNSAQDLSIRRQRTGTIVVVSVAAAYLVIGGLLLLKVPGLLLQEWLPKGNTDDYGKLLGVAAQIVLFGLGGVIAIAGVSLSILRHRQELAAAERDRQRLRDDRERELRARFVTAVDLLSADSATKRTAALYALAALADDWDSYGRGDEVQVCVDVICGYLRAPLAEGTTSTPVAEVAVRNVGFALINQHLLDQARHSWGARTINLARIYLDQPAIFFRPRIRTGGHLTFDGATIAAKGALSLGEATVQQGGTISMTGARIEELGEVEIDELTVCKGGLLEMRHVSVRLVGAVSITNSTILNGALLDIDEAIVHSGGYINLGGLAIESRNGVTLRGAEIGEEAELSLYSLYFAEGATLSLDQSKTRGSGQILFDGATIQNNKVLLDGAKIASTGPIELPSGDWLLPEAN
ncbi:hypothetical protein I6E74_12630 [Salinibacterium sp. SWN139]|uniref:hypothetical protein n=1 Tax=Salinibacterium sp. SWN139 TaxID=2792055 RepID=UPI0018CCAF9F|nr:hypothetical protein [Salinibacterium sp. SWN139]MBH0055012.1 hypothetical protein [Salinibacterium sp. SWN139]